MSKRQIPILTTADGDRNSFIEYAVNQSLIKVNTILPAKVLSVNDDSTLLIQPIMRTASTTQVYDAPLIDNVPTLKWQGGSAGIIIEYKADDLVLIGACQRDMTNVFESMSSDLKSPMSNRKFCLADAVVLSKLSKTPPTTYIKITDDGVEIMSDKVTVNSPNIELGQNAMFNLLTTNTVMQVSGVQGGSETVPVQIVSGASPQVKAGS